MMRRRRRPDSRTHRSVAPQRSKRLGHESPTLDLAPAARTPRARTLTATAMPICAAEIGRDGVVRAVHSVRDRRAVAVPTAGVCHRRRRG